MRRIDYTASREFEQIQGCDCDKDGFRHVAAGYVDAVTPGDPIAAYQELTRLAEQVTAGTIDMAVFDRAASDYNGLIYRQAVAADSVFPCPWCKPGQYAMWRNGCFDLGHKRASCTTCGPNRTSPA